MGTLWALDMVSRSVHRFPGGGRRGGARRGYGRVRSKTARELGDVRGRWFGRGQLPPCRLDRCEVTLGVSFAQGFLGVRCVASDMRWVELWNVT